MNHLKHLFSKYTGILRSLKLSYVINNLINYKRLNHNRKMLSRLGLKRNVMAPVGTSDLPQSNELPWLDRPDALEKLKSHSEWHDFTKQEQKGLITFVEEGFMILNGFYSEEEIDQHNSIVEELRQKKKIDFNYSGSKLMDVYEESDWVDEKFFKNPGLMKLLAFIFQKPVLPFQTIHFVQGSQQKAHSDSIHMSTFPPGYLLAAWTALEDIGMEQGPIFYYPGSHRLPYISTEDYESGNTTWTIGKNSYKNYEKYIEAQIASLGMQPRYFKPKKGDVLIWHANLLHGGSKINKEDSTRRSMVAHYYADGVFCYHEISQRPALIKPD